MSLFSIAFLSVRPMMLFHLGQKQTNKQTTTNKQTNNTHTPHCAENSHQSITINDRRLRQASSVGQRSSRRDSYPEVGGRLVFRTVEVPGSILARPALHILCFSLAEKKILDSMSSCLFIFGGGGWGWGRGLGVRRTTCAGPKCF